MTPIATRLDSRTIPIARHEIRCFATIRNEAMRLPYFLCYHRELGVDRFFFVDNASDDNSVEYLLSQPDTHVFYTEQSYAESRCGIDWLNKLLDDYGTGHWTLTLDADELLVFPTSEEVGIRKLTQFLESAEADALLTFLLDMYSRNAIRDTMYQPGEPFHGVCNYFDADTYHQVSADGIPIRGGPRHRLFWQGHDRQKPSPVLRKIPLVKWRAELKYEASTHVIPGVRTLTSLTGVLMHFKFFSDFYTEAENEAARKEHWDSAAQYAAYWNTLCENPSLSAYFEGSVKYTNSMQLVELGLLRMAPGFSGFRESS